MQLSPVAPTGSWRAAEKAGFVREGLLRSWRWAGHDRRDMYVCSLLPHDLPDAGRPAGRYRPGPRSCLRQDWVRPGTPADRPWASAETQPGAFPSRRYLLCHLPGGCSIRAVTAPNLAFCARKSIAAGALTCPPGNDQVPRERLRSTRCCLP